jgi:hypothetical protein
MSGIGPNVDRTAKPNTIDLSLATDGATVGYDRQVTNGISVGGDVGSSRGQATVGAHVTDQIFPDKAFSPFATLGVNADMGGDKGFGADADLKGGVDYRFSNGFQIGAYAGVDRSFTDSASPWGAEAGITAGISF